MIGSWLYGLQTAIDKGWRATKHISVLKGKNGGPVTEAVTAGDVQGWYKTMADNQDRTLAFIDKSVAGQKPFFIAYWPQRIAFVANGWWGHYLDGVYQIGVV
ncbi:MAG: hypothetical protein ACR2PG_08710 [Hyphomicrobiaceae bacterium]